jgi:hypothetical protein
MYPHTLCWHGTRVFQGGFQTLKAMAELVSSPAIADAEMAWHVEARSGHGERAVALDEPTTDRIG